MDCPECGLELHDYARSCRCGWHKSYALERPKPKPYTWEPINPEILEKVRGTLGKPTDPRTWARKILERSAAGEHVNLWALECAKQSAGEVRMREPGEEG